MLEESWQKIINFLQKELNGLQTGKASSSLIEDLLVDSYGMKQPLKHIANISISDNQSIMIDPWDKKTLADIEKAVQKDSALGFSMRNDGVVLRLSLPPLNEERRQEIVKLMHKFVENARIAVRNLRHEVQGKLKKQKEKADISEDQFFKEEKALQEKVDQLNKQIEEMSKKKETEILTI